MPGLVDIASETQCGGLADSATDVASHLLRQTVEHHRSRKTIIVFVDVIAAFYNVVRSLITDISPLLQDARHITSGLPSALAATSLDANVLNSVTAQFVATWFSIVGSDTVSKFHRDVMPGDPEAGQQFTLVISMLLNTLCTQLATEGIEASIPHVPPDEAILSARRDTPPTWNLGVSYVDDIALAIPVHADQVIKTLRSTILVLRRVVRQFRLPLNFSAGETEALLDAFDPGARALRMALCNTHACSVNCADEHGSTTIRICRAYKHLGSIVSVQANMTPEVLARTSAQSCCGRHSCPCSLCSKHRATNQECGALFLCFEQVFLPNSYLAEAQFHSDMRKMEGSGCPCPDGIPSKSTAQMLSKVSQPLQIAMAAARLLFLPRLLKVIPTT